MDLKKLFPMLMLLALFANFAFAATTPTGNPNTLCSTVDDLNESGGCIATDEAPNILVSAGTIFVLAFAGLASLVILAFVANKYFGIGAKNRKV